MTAQVRPGTETDHPAPGMPPCTPGEGLRCDRGSSTVLAVALGAGALTLVGLLGLGAQAFLAHARVDAAADLAAIAAADAARGITPGDPCEVAGQTAEHSGAEVTECIARSDLGTAKVVTEIDLPAPLGKVTATAVAGSPTGQSR
ncbi:Rv3654c family TadE-like protein [Brevibacterium ihuae]|uniref:Rv3654c family TadE-like protein n=1 Tax=Brevibacterium ihuae TaxID=1631743 RepID=UPI003182EBC9